MDTMIYLFKVNIAIAIFCVVYRVFYRKDTFFSMRRYLLQSILFLSILYPLMDISHWMMHSTTMADIAMSYKNMLPEIVVYSSGAEMKTTNTLNVTSYPALNYFLGGYAVVACFLLFRILFRTMQIVWLRLHSKPMVIEGVRIRRLTTDTTPFSFFSWVFINPDMHDDKELHEVLSHEMVHVRQRHSIDILIVEFLCAFCWINPMIWMIKKEIQKNLEFIVDHCVISQSEIDVKSYQYHLLKLAHHPSKMALANQFNISPLKERIVMINIKKSPKIKLVTYTLVLPLVMLFLVVNNVGAVADRIGHNERVKNVVTKVSDIVSDLSPEMMVPERNVVVSIESNDKPIVTEDKNRKKEISGILLNEETKMPLAGVNVVVYNTTTGTVSDAEGRFKLMVNEGDTLNFSFVGFSGFTLTAHNLPVDLGALSMSRNSVELGEIYVVGYESNHENLPLPGRSLQEQENDNNDEPGDIVFVTVEKMPEFPGGEQALLKYIAEHINYPVAAAENGIQGRVACKFTIKEDGSVGNVHVVRSVDPSLDDEAMRVIYSMPKWIPGEQRGKKVAVEYSVPVRFRLQSDKKPSVDSLSVAAISENLDVFAQLEIEEKAESF